jgi:hypothetical protein
MPTENISASQQKALKRATRIAARIDRIDVCLAREKGQSPKSKTLVANLKEEREARQAELKFMSFKAEGAKASNG